MSVGKSSLIMEPSNNEIFWQNKLAKKGCRETSRQETNRQETNCPPKNIPNRSNHTMFSSYSNIRVIKLHIVIFI